MLTIPCTSVRLLDTTTKAGAQKIEETMWSAMSCHTRLHNVQPIQYTILIARQLCRHAEISSILCFCTFKSRPVYETVCILESRTPTSISWCKNKNEKTNWYHSCIWKHGLSWIKTQRGSSLLTHVSVGNIQKIWIYINLESSEVFITGFTLAFLR